VHAAAVILATFALVFVAELPDKTAIASLLLGTRYRPLWVFVGVGAAFAFHVALAVTAGSLLGLLPHRLLQGIVAGLFAVGAVLLLRGRSEETPKVAETEPGFWHVAATGFTVVFVAEFGDLTQFVTANLAAHYRDPIAVGAGALAGLLCVAGLALAGGRALLRVLPITWLTRLAALAMLTLAGFSLASAVTGLSRHDREDFCPRNGGRSLRDHELIRRPAGTAARTA
jgi:Ca2+/H+ antiporter, TMEM165/GDT1 family